MPFAQDKAVALFPLRVLRVMAHGVKIEAGNDVGCRKGTAGMAGTRGGKHSNHLFTDFLGDGGKLQFGERLENHSEGMIPYSLLMIHPALFYPVSILCVAGALGVVLARHPVYAVLSLGVTLFGLSSLFIALQATFVAMIQILVYAGAILVLFLFVVMLLDLGPEALGRARTRTLGIGGVVVAFLFLRQFVRVARTSSFAPAAAPTPGLPAAGSVAGTTAAVGQELFTTYALPFEVASFILLAGIVGAIVLAKKKA